MQNTCGTKDSSGQPQTFNGDLAALPAALRPLTEHRRWVVWKWEKTKSGNWTKPPHRADDPRAKARSNDPATWSTYATAVAAVTGRPRRRHRLRDDSCGRLAQRHRRARPRQMSRSRTPAK